MRRPRGEVAVTPVGDLVVIRPKRFEFPLWAVVFGLMLRYTWRCAWWCLRHPGSTVLAITAVWLYFRFDWPGLVVPLACVGLLAGVWRWRHAPSWWAWFGGPLLGQVRRVFVYRRAWREAMVLCGLSRKYNQQLVLPRLLRVRSDEALDVVTTRMLRGQTPTDFQKATANLAYAFGRRHARVYSERPDEPPPRTGRLAWMLRAIDRVRYRDRPTVVYLVLVRTDALRKLVKPFPVSQVPDFTALPMAMREDLRIWCLHLLATHVLVGGATRRGKGSVLWSLVRAMCGGISSGLVRLWVIDPKGGMEFAMGRPMFARFACKSFEAMADLLDEAVAAMKERQDRLAGAVRVHAPTEADPLIVVVIDEMSTLTAYLQDSDLKRRIAGSLGLLLSQGAGVGLLVVAALQDPRKEVLPFRDLFPTRIALGLTEDSQVDMVLGDGARDRGALADQMPRWAKGVGYVILDGTPDPMRVRFSFISDDDIRAMARDYPAPADAADILAQVGRETATEPIRSIPGPRRPTGPLLPDSLLAALDSSDNDKDDDR
jgi:DNA segregation ATPase FtsK/SpoIIIE, S-DNA-T family